MSDTFLVETKNQLPRLGYRGRLCVSLMDMAERTILMFHGLGGDRHTMLPIGEYCAGHLPRTMCLPIEGPINHCSLMGHEGQPSFRPCSTA